MRHFLLSLFLTLISVSIFSQCAGNVSYTLDIPPNPDLTYPPNTTIELCVTMDGWNGNSTGSNWFEGFGLTLGSGWITSTPTLTPNDAGADGSGAWLWMNTVTSSATGLTVGPGFFFEGPQGPVDSNPGNDWGDNCNSGNCTWIGCVSLTASSVSGESLNIQVTPYADGTMGSWTNSACSGQDPPTDIFTGVVGCSICGCIDPNACNFDPTVCCDDGTCNYFSIGTISPNPDTVCVNTNTFYSVNGNSTSLYDWSVTGGTVNTNQSVNSNVVWGDVPGDYVLSVQEITPAGCISSVVISNIVVVDPKVTFDSSYHICYNQSIILSANPPGGSWSGDYVNGSTFIGSTPGISWPTYTTSVYNCIIDNSVRVVVEPLYQPPILLYSKLNLDLCLDPNEQNYTVIDSRSTSYVWTVDNVFQFNNDNSLYVDWYDTTNTYLINVYGIDNLGCKSETSGINIHTESCERFYAPNSFTPNGDGINDIFRITGLSVYQPTLKIFDRWGIEIYRSPNLYWTGDGGTGYYCNSDVYTWVVEYKDKEGFNKIQKGFVTLIR